MYYVTIDCGTTNSRIFVVDIDGNVISKAAKNVGVKDTAISGSKAILKTGLIELFQEVLISSKLDIGQIKLILSSGMITSELGLKEIPHLWAPCKVSDLAENIHKVDNIDISGNGLPVYFVPGIKNKFDPAKINSMAVDSLDFMRGEETQVAGILKLGLSSLPLLIVILSSHTKLITVDSSGTIIGSLTTMSGQLYDAVVNHTFVGKSIFEDNKKKSIAFNSDDVIGNAARCIKESGLIRSLMFPRFMDVLLDTDWRERKLFLDALIAAEDLKIIPQLEKIGKAKKFNVVLVGDSDRCDLYDVLLREELRGAQDFVHLSKNEEIDSLGIKGVLSIAGMANLL